MASSFTPAMDSLEATHLLLLGQMLRQRVDPADRQRTPPQLMGLQVHHTTTAYSCRGGNCKIHHLKNHVHLGTHGDDLSTVQAQFLIVIKHRVHVFDPDGINRAIQKEPLAVWGRVGCAGTECHCKDSICPLMAYWVELPVQLSHGDRLGVDDVVLRFLLQSCALGLSAQVSPAQAAKSRAMLPGSPLPSHSFSSGHRPARDSWMSCR